MGVFFTPIAHFPGGPPMLIDDEENNCESNNDDESHSNRNMQDYQELEVSPPPLLGRVLGQISNRDRVEISYK
jgi:hypothetical protein